MLASRAKFPVRNRFGGAAVCARSAGQLVKLFRMSAGVQQQDRTDLASSKAGPASFRDSLRLRSPLFDKCEFNGGWHRCRQLSGIAVLGGVETQMSRTADTPYGSTEHD
jgi:hypothetical protein